MDPHVELMSLAQLGRLGGWQLELLHDNPFDLLIWITKGQGLALLDGSRRGVGTHNALFVPAGNLMSLELGRQGFGQALILPQGLDITLPERVLHLRIRDVAAQNELTAIFEAIGREQNAARPLFHSAVKAHADLASIWLRRHWHVERHDETAARRLTRAYFDRVARYFADGSSMADHASALGVTPTHLTRVCRSETGKTAAALLTERILHRARELLVSTDVPVQDIASSLGFGSAAYFTRFIKHHSGHSPMALRRMASR
ncbi:AraC family transcriptional regulator [Arenibacterium sp. CAU 1754]